MKRILIYILLPTVLVGCGHNEIDVPTPNDSFVMNFGAPVVESPVGSDGRSGAGSTLMTASSMKGYSIGVYGRDETRDNIFDNLPENLYFYTGSVGAYKNQWVYGDPADYGTASEPRKEWNRIVEHEFRAFHPYDPTGLNREEGLSSARGIQAMTDATRLVLNYYTQVNKFDLMVARATRYPATEGVGKVELEFKHTLAALQFELKYATDEVDQLTYARIDGICESGTLYYGRQLEGDGEENIRWILPIATSDELYEWEGSVSFDKNTAARPFDGDGLIFVIPQSIDVAQASFVFKTASGDDAEQHAYLPKITWEPGKKYLYTITVRGAEVDVAVTIKPWETKKSNVDIYIQ